MSTKRFQLWIPIVLPALLAITLVLFVRTDQVLSSAPESADLAAQAAPAEAALNLDWVQPAVQDPIQDEIFYFVMPDRFRDGDAANNQGGLTGDRSVHGFDPTDTGYYHGGDLQGLLGEMDYLEGLGVTAIWMTPMFKNRPVQDATAAYHGYWIEDFTQIDPHFGTDLELRQVITEAHNRGIKIFFDIITNHTADVIRYEEGEYGYRNKADFPYRDASGAAFNDRDFVGLPSSQWPVLSSTLSFPYTPIFDTPTDAAIKAPAWLNNPIYYHNRGDSTFAGENSLYGDFYGLDDLFTEHPDVVDGMIEIYEDWVDYGVDGFRVDTVKHVNLEFWQKFAPAILAHAQATGNPDFFIFGEVYSANKVLLSEYTTDGKMPSVLDFGFQSAAQSYASTGQPSDNLRDFFASDDQFTDADSNVYSLLNFIGNHDMGRFGRFISVDNPGADDAEMLARDKLGHALMYFARGVPVVYYGDEQGFTGDGGDRGAREDMFPSQSTSYNDNDLIGTISTTADANFDTAHPLYVAFSTYADLYQGHKALRRGAQIHRYSTDTAGIYAFSRIDRDDKVDYLVAFNNAESQQQASFAVYQASASFTAIYTGGNLTVPAVLTSDAQQRITVTVPALSFVVYRADAALPASTAAPNITIHTLANDQVVELDVDNLDGNAVLNRIEVGAQLDADVLAEVTFAVRPSGSSVTYTLIGVDTNAPYRVFYDPGQYITSETPLDFIAIVNDLNGHTNTTLVTGIVPRRVQETAEGYSHAVLHYLRADGDYGDHTAGSDYWGLHFWGSGVGESVEWTAPKPFLGQDDYGRFSWITLTDSASDIGFIVHRGDVKDGTEADRSFNPNTDGPEIWLKGGDPNFYTSQAAAQGYVTIHYRRPDGAYYTSTTDYWGLHLWGDAIDPSEGTDWGTPKPPTGVDDFGAYYVVSVTNVAAPVNFIVHKGDVKDPGPDQAFDPSQTASVWIMSGDETIYTQRGAAQRFVTLHYRRPAGDYGDYGSANYADFWGMHAWGNAPDPGWSTPHRPVATDTFGITFRLDLSGDPPVQMGYILHRGDDKDPGPDQSLEFATYGYEVWQVQAADPENPYILPLPKGAQGVCDLATSRAYWVSEDTLAWDVDYNPNYEYALHYALNGGIACDGTDAINGGQTIPLTYDPAGLPVTITAKFPHLAGMAAFKIAAANLAQVPAILKGQIAVSASDPGNEGMIMNATGLQIPGVLDDLYTYAGELGLTYSGAVPTLSLWAPTAQTVTLRLFDDSGYTAYPMSHDAATGVWSVTGDASWTGKFYLYDVEVYVHSTGRLEHNLVTDPYAVSLAMNSTRSQIVNLRSASLQPAGWGTLAKPLIEAPEDIALYELHVRDFSVNDDSVPEAYKGTFKAFTVLTSTGMAHLQALADAGLTHLHLLPVFDIATIDEDKSQWVNPDWTVLATYPPTSTQQRETINPIRDQDGFNWGYDPYHYTVPEGSYSTDPDGTTRIVEFREMVQALNGIGINVVMDVVYNHTNAAGQAQRSVLDKIVPGYYHRLDGDGAVTTSTCCPNTATEHNMMRKLMIDSVVTWVKSYKVDGFRFDLMGHHMKADMLALRAALDELTLAEDGVDGSRVYVYGEGWNFGEVQNGARGENATQINMAGTGIGTFNDRLRDGVRGGGPFDHDNTLVTNQGFINGMYYDPNELNDASPDELSSALLAADRIRVGLAGNLADYEFVGMGGTLVSGSEVDYNGSPAGYNQDPQEHIIYIEAHDNQTLYDNNQYKMPLSSSMDERARAQNVGLSIVSLAQGVPFFHAGSDMLRSKSMERNSYNASDWFNKLDFTYNDNNWGVGLPADAENEQDFPLMIPRLGNPALKPAQADILQSVQHLREMLQLRKSSPLFRLRTAVEIQNRLRFYNTGPNQIPGLIVMTLSDPAGDLDPRYGLIAVLFNANDEAQTFALPSLAGRAFTLHPLQADGYDPVVKTSTYNRLTGSFGIPARTTAVFVSMRYGVLLEPATASLTGNPGQTVTYTLRLTNTGDVTDAFGLNYAGNNPAWVVELPVSSYTLAAGAGTDVLVRVTVPADAADGATDAVTVTVYFMGTPAVPADASRLTTTANVVTTYGVTLAPATAAAIGYVGTRVSYTLRVTNTGSAADTFAITYAGNTWPVSLPAAQVTLAAGAGANVVVNVDVPANAANGATDSVTIAATSQASSSTTDSSTLTTTARRYILYLPVVMKGF